MRARVGEARRLANPGIVTEPSSERCFQALISLIKFPAADPT
jgi:hypothetical protein